MVDRHNHPVIVEVAELYDDYSAGHRAVSTKALEALFGTTDQRVKPKDLGPEYKDLVVQRRESVLFVRALCARTTSTAMKSHQAPTNGTIQSDQPGMRQLKPAP